MQFPIDLHVGSFTISTHLVLETLGIFIGFRYFIYLRKKKTDTITDSNRMVILIGTTFGALLFSRLLGAFENPETFFQSQHKFLYFYANKTIVGALLGGLIGAETAKKIIGEKSSSGDLYVYPLLLSMMVGRIGCFSMGVHEETYGVPTSSIFGMDLGDGLMRHPVTLYEIAYLLCLWIIFHNIDKRVTLANGVRFKLFMIAYLTFRLLLDFIKPGSRYLFGLGTIQISCILGLIYYSKTIYSLLFNRKALIVYAQNQ